MIGCPAPLCSVVVQTEEIGYETMVEYGSFDKNLPECSSATRGNGATSVPPLRRALPASLRAVLRGAGATGLLAGRFHVNVKVVTAAAARR